MTGISVSCLVNAQSVSELSMDTIYLSSKFEHAAELTSSVVYLQDQSILKLVQEDGTIGIRTAPSQHDYMYFIPDETNPNSRGRLILNHERNNYKTNYPELGEGGGMAIVPVIKQGANWIIDEDYNPSTKDTAIAVDFSTVGWTTTNCGGFILGNGNHATAEEIFSNFSSNKAIANRHDTLQNKYGYDGKGNYTIPVDYPEFGGQTIKMNENLGWMVEVDPNKAKAVRKLYHMGRYSHEGGIAMEDGKTVYLTDDFYPAILFKYVADVKNDYSKGNLYAFKQDEDFTSGKWVQIERNLDSLINAREVALRKGATMFMRLEWAAVANGKVYIAETGRDNQNVSYGVNLGAKPANHWVNPPASATITYDNNTNIIDHPYGALLVLDDRNAESPDLKIHLAGGTSTTKGFNFASVDGVWAQTIGDKTWFVLQEDLIGRSRGRMPEYNQADEVPEAFFLDASIENPTVDDLHLICAGSQGSELTGACFTPDGSTMFINHQHPATTNTPPYDKSASIAVTGLEAIITSIPKLDESAPVIKVYPNPVFGELHFNKTVDVEFYNSNGQMIKSAKAISSIPVYDLAKGVYIVKMNDGKKLFSKTVVVK